MLLMMVATYSGCPLMVSWAKVVGSEEVGPREVPIKGRPFKESSVIVANWLIVASVGLLLSAGKGGVAEVKRCFDAKAIARFAPAGIGWACADVFEVMAVARIDPATYSVISQARLLSAAVACRCLRGMEQSLLQWGMLLSLSLVCMTYCIIPDDNEHNYERLFRWRLGRSEIKMNWYHTWPAHNREEQQAPPDHEFLIGVLFALSKVLLSVLSGVYGEMCFKAAKPGGGSEKPVGLHIQMTQISFSSLLAALAGYWIICLIQGEEPSEFFSGPDGMWDLRTVIVACLYAWREYLSNIVVKHFDSVVKNICNAVALLTTYIFMVMVSREKPFSILKACVLAAVVIEVLKYAHSKRQPQAKPAEVAKIEQHKNGSLKPNGIHDVPVAEYKSLSDARKIA